MKTIFPFLTYVGALPFIFSGFCLSLNLNILPLIGSIPAFLSVYGVVIASFLAGSHWGMHLTLSSTWTQILPIASNCIAVSLWAGFLYLPFSFFMAWLVFHFIALLFIDFQLMKQKLISSTYFNVRLKVSIIVIISLVISGLAS